MKDLDFKGLNNQDLINLEIVRDEIINNENDIIINTENINQNTTDIAQNTADILTKAPIASPTFTGTVTAPSLIVEDLTDGYVPYQVASTDKLGDSGIYTDTSGNVAIRTTTLPTATSGLATVVIGPNQTFHGDTALGADKALNISQNAAVANGTWKYISTDKASNYYQYDGTHVWRFAASGTAGDTITWTTGMSLDNSGNVWILGDCSFESFHDRTPFYVGDALKEIAAIQGKDGEIDHSTLPDFVRSEKTMLVPDNKTMNNIIPTLEEKTIVERDVGAMVSMLTVAIQQLLARIEKLEGK